jgi:hypothetical protein
MSLTPPAPRRRFGHALALAALVAGGCSFANSGGSVGSPPNNTSGAGNGPGASTGAGGLGNTLAGTAGDTGQGSAGTFASGEGGSPNPTGAAGESTGAAGSTGFAGSVGTGAGGAPSGAAGTGPQDGGIPDGGSAGTSAGCLVAITPVMPASFSNLEAGTVLRVHASVSGYAGNPDGGAPHWLWSVSVSTSANAGYTAVDDSTIDVSLVAGTYLINASIEGAPSCNRLPIQFMVSAGTPALRFRVTPPASVQLPVRETIVKMADLATTPTLDLGDALASELVSLSPVDARNFPIPSYIRITSPPFTFDLEGYTARGALIAPLSTGLTYDVLIVPDGGLAPLLLSGAPDAVSASMAITPGATVTGVMRDGAGNPVVGGRVILQAGARPSTVGVSAADGTFALSTREGSHSVDIVPPAGSGLPEAQVSGMPGVMLVAGMTGLDLAMDWAKVPASALTIAVSGHDGAPLPGARVRATLATPIANAGTLHVNGLTTADLQATGTAHADGVTDAQGAAHLGLLPNGVYHVVVAPPDGAVSAAITLAPDVTVPMAGSPVPVIIAAPVTFSGTLAPSAGAAGAKVTAIDNGPLAAATLPSTTVALDGSYSLALAAGRTYELLVEPNPALGSARTVLPLVTPPASGLKRIDVLPKGIAWSGTVTGAGRAVGGALVQVYCAAPASSCVDPGLALAQGTTGADGSIALLLPGTP